MKNNNFTLYSSREGHRKCVCRALMVPLLVFMFLFIDTFSLSAQRSLQLQGVVKDSASVPLLNCSVLLCAVGDTLPLYGASTDRAGRYVMQVDTGYYRMQVSHVGYETFVRDLHLDKAEATAVDVMLMPSARQLDEVVITEEIEQSVKVERDKVVYTLSSQAKRAAGNVFMALRSVPELEVNLNKENISLFGSNHTVVMVNGVRRNKGYLQMIDPKSIESVEVIRTPSMRYAINGVDGIVNIVTKKPVKGYSAYVTATQDLLLREGSEGGGFTRVADKWVFSIYASNFYFNEKSKNGRSERTRDVLEGDEWIHYEEKTSKRYSPSQRFPYDRQQPNLNLSLDYRHSENSYTIFSLYGQHMYEEHKYISDVVQEGSGDKREYEERSRYLALNQSGKATIYHETNWNKKHTLSADLSYGRGVNRNSDFLTKQEVELAPFYCYDRYNYADNQTAEGQLNVDHVWKKVTLQEGYRLKWNRNDKMYRINGVRDPLLFDEWRSNLYANVWWKINRWWDVAAGLNMEYQRLKSDVTTFSSPELMPGLTIRFDAQKYNLITLRYNRSRQIPGISLLDPTVITSDSINFYVGNPSLKPTYTDQLALSYQKIAYKYNIYAAFFYSWGDRISTLRTVNERGQQIITYENASNYRRPSLYLSMSATVLPGWKVGVKSEAYCEMYDDPNNAQFSGELWGGSVRVSSDLSYKKFYVGFDLPIPCKQRTLTGYRRFNGETSVNASYNLNNHWTLYGTCRYVIPMYDRNFVDLEGYRQYSYYTSGRQPRIILGARYYVQRGDWRKQRQKKTREYNGSVESDVDLKR